MASAAEKLRALHREQLQEGRWPSLPDGREEIILNALPAIIAVTEAATALSLASRDQVFQIADRDVPDDQVFWALRDTLDAALATLSQALEETP